MSAVRHAGKIAWRRFPSRQCRPFASFSRWLHTATESQTAAANAHYDARQYLSNFFTPVQGLKNTVVPVAGGQDVDIGTELLVRGGYMRHAYSGIFHLLPLGLRVQNKVESLIDRHMQGALGASKLSLSCVTSEALWRKSGRYQTGRDSEFFNITDRKGSKYLLSPTHEEEITTIVGNAVTSYDGLPLRVYQISRKYRDEARPRQGLLRGREFVMKDLYTFDASEESALQTYQNVRRAYRAIFEEIGLPFIVGSADSGNMGGSLSHEYHYPSRNGEDTIVKCNDCDYCANEEVHFAAFDREKSPTNLPAQTLPIVSKDKRTLFLVYFPADGTLNRPSHTVKESLNMHVLQKIFPTMDSSVDNGIAIWESEQRSNSERSATIVTVFDPRVGLDSLEEGIAPDDVSKRLQSYAAERRTGLPILGDDLVILTSPQDGDQCPKCTSGKLKTRQAVEIGHTFHLGDRYSKPLKAQVTNAKNEVKDMHMGCHGIGVSRLVGAIASLLADEKGLRWPLSIAPFSTAILLNQQKTGLADAQQLCDAITAQTGLDVVIDERERRLPWKLNDADLIGYPFVLVFGKAWAENGAVEMQCRSLDVKTNVLLDQVPATMKKLAGRLRTRMWSGE